MFETPSKEMNDTSPLLPRHRSAVDENFEALNKKHHTRKMLSGIGACVVVVLCLIAYVAYTSGDESSSVISFVAGDTYQGYHCDLKTGYACKRRVAGFCAESFPCVNVTSVPSYQSTNTPSNEPTPKPT